ncbi:MAG: hypothetical protein ACRD1R_06565 [Acidobacteriota bacterium]
MERLIVLILLIFGLGGTSLGRLACVSEIKGLKLPVEVKTDGNPPVARWAQVDETLTRLRESLPASDCQVTFGEIFRTDKRDLYIPLTNNLIRTVPEETLKDLTIYNTEAEELGHFANRVVFERSGGGYALSSYKLYYFQFRDQSGKLQSSGNRQFIDMATGDPLFLIKWEELKERTAIS